MTGDDKFEERKNQALVIIQKQVLTLRKKMCAFGLSHEQFMDAVCTILGKIVCTNKNKHKLKNINDIIKAVSQYVDRNRSRVQKLLVELITSFDQQIAEIDSSSPGEQENQDSEAEKAGLKFQDHRLVKKDSLPLDKTKLDEKQGNENCYVKLQSFPEVQIEIQPVKPNNQDSSRSRRYPNKRNRRSINQFLF